jgi:hypothetical protein
MNETVSVDSLMRFLRATPEQRAVIDRFLVGVPGELGGCEERAGALDCKSALAEILRRIGAVAEGLHGLQQENGQLRNAKARLE